MSETSPLQVLEQAVMAAQANREAREAKLRAMPRWRFRRRRQMEESLRRRRDSEESMREVLVSAEPHQD